MRCEGVGCATVSNSGVGFGSVNGCMCVRCVGEGVRCGGVRCGGVRGGVVCTSIASAASSQAPFPCRRGLSLAGRWAIGYLPRGANSYLPRETTRYFPSGSLKRCMEITRYTFRGATTYLPRGATTYLLRGNTAYLLRGATTHLPKGATRCPLWAGNSQTRAIHLHLLHFLPLNWGVPLLVRPCDCGGVLSPPPLARGVAAGDVQVRVLLNLPDGLRKVPHPLGLPVLLLLVVVGGKVTRQHPRTGGGERGKEEGNY